MSPIIATRQTRYSVKNGSAPKWFHPVGKKMQLGGYQIVTTLAKEFVLLGCKGHQVQIIPAGQAFKLLWQINGTYPLRHFQGEILFDSEQLQLAFNLCSTVSNGHNSEWDRKQRGLFIGKGPYLNIPGPGTGEDGDPNISVFVTEEVKEAIKQLLNSRR
jgi:hypothetical protein